MNILTPQDLKRRLDAGERWRIVDVRELPEWQMGHIAGAEHHPLSQAAQWLGSLEAGQGPYVFYCHHGRRSAQVCGHLAQLGREDVYNLLGGVDGWSVQVDPSVPRY